MGGLHRGFFHGSWAYVVCMHMVWFFCTQILKVFVYFNCNRKFTFLLDFGVCVFVSLIWGIYHRLRCFPWVWPPASSPFETFQQGLRPAWFSADHNRLCKVMDFVISVNSQGILRILFRNIMLGFCVEVCLLKVRAGGPPAPDCSLPPPQWVSPMCRCAQGCHGKPFSRSMAYVAFVVFVPTASGAPPSP